MLLPQSFSGLTYRVLNFSHICLKKFIIYITIGLLIRSIDNINIFLNSSGYCIWYWILFVFLPPVLSKYQLIESLAFNFNKMLFLSNLEPVFLQKEGGELKEFICHIAIYFYLLHNCTKLNWQLQTIFWYNKIYLKSSEEYFSFDRW